MKEGNGCVVSPFEFQSTPLINVPCTAQGIQQMRVILERNGERKKRNIKEEKPAALLEWDSFEKQFLFVCLG
jgi:hypothetical protein